MFACSGALGGEMLCKSALEVGEIDEEGEMVDDSKGANAAGLSLEVGVNVAAGVVGTE